MCKKMPVDPAAEAFIEINIFMMNQKLWPDEEKACNEVLEILKRYAK